MSATIIIARHTARQFRVESYSSVAPSSKAGCFSAKRLRRSEETLEHAHVMAALSQTLRSMPYSKEMNLKALFDLAKAGPFRHMLSSATYAAPTSAGVPARLIVKGQEL